MTATATAAIRPGTHLRNGATILKAVHYATETQGAPARGGVPAPTVSRYYVLALSRDEFVTWALFVRDDLADAGLPLAAIDADGREVSETTWGHYFGSDLDAALADLAERVGG